MNTPETPNGPRDGQEIAEIRQAVESLRTMFHLSALCGIVVGVSLYLFLHKQTANVQRGNDELRGYVEDYNTNFVPKVEIMRTNLEAFAKTHATLAPLLDKYFPAKPPVPKP
jgi:hypothetical protein